jgi:ribonuclease P protein component
MRFRPRQHIRRPADFAAVRNEGRRHFGTAFIFSHRRRSPEPRLDLPRFAIVASRKVGPAVTRNRLKRCLREIFREHQRMFPDGVDIVIVLRPGGAGWAFADLEREFLRLARKAGYDASASRGEPAAAPVAPAE